MIDTEKAPLAQRLGLRASDGASGVMVKSVLRGGAAEQAGMAAGDEWLAVEVGQGKRAQTWRLKKLDDLPLFLGTAQRCRALVNRDQRLYWMNLKWPQLASNWSLSAEDDLKGWL